MNKTAIAFLTKDRVELSKQSIEPLLQPDKFDLFWIDGSTSAHGKNLPNGYPVHKVYSNVTGGAGAGIVFALTKMLEAGYEHLALVENDVCLPADWFTAAMDLFRRGADDGLVVGAVSARNYQDRVLFQRDGYSVNHNLGAGMIVLTREAAQIVLNSFRSGWSTDNRRIFSQLGAGDIGPFWAFKDGDHPLVADWAFDSTLAAHGLASLALTPSHVEMIGQVPPLAEQGLTIVKEPVAERIDNDGFQRYRARLRAVRDGQLKINVETQFQFIPNVGWQYCPHQWHMIGGERDGDWLFREARAHGEFAWVAGEETDPYPTVTLPLYGMASLLVSGGKHGGKIEILDHYSNYRAVPVLPPEGSDMTALQVPLPSNHFRDVTITALTPGVCLYKLTTAHKQPSNPLATFDHSILPPPV